MKIRETIGIDVSKKTIDVFVYSVKRHKVFKNNVAGFLSMQKWVEENSSFEQSELLYALEHTGLYSLPLSVYLSEQKSYFVMIPGLELKKSLGLVRGKDDKLDSSFIALYAYRKREELTPYELPSKILLELRRLLSLRDKLVKQRSGFKSTLTEMKAMLLDKESPVYMDIHESMCKSLSEEIKKVEKELLKLIKDDDELQEQFKLITSIDGVGVQTALFMIAFTGGFTLFETSRRFASYAGVAPFPYCSGTSIRGRTRISSYGNQQFKSLLSNCATTAIRNNSELRLYYERRISEGKSKMGTINIIRNKLLGRIFAVVHREHLMLILLHIVGRFVNNTSKKEIYFFFLLVYVLESQTVC